MIPTIPIPKGFSVAERGTVAKGFTVAKCRSTIATIIPIPERFSITERGTVAKGLTVAKCRTMIPTIPISKRLSITERRSITKWFTVAERFTIPKGSFSTIVATAASKWLSVTTISFSFTKRLSITERLMFSTVVASALGRFFWTATKTMICRIVAHPKLSAESFFNRAFRTLVVFFCHKFSNNLFAMDFPSIPSIWYRSFTWPCSTNPSGKPKRKRR